MRRRLVLIVLVSLCALALVPFAVNAAPPSASPSLLPSASPSLASSQALANVGTVTATGSAVIPPPDDPVTVYMVQLQGQINTSDPKLTYDAYVAKLGRIHQAVIDAGVPADKVTPAQAYVQPTGTNLISFNSVFRYEVKATGAVQVAVAQAAFGAGASMVYNNMPATAVTVRRPEGAALDKAIAEATAMARDYATRAAGRAVGDAVATTLTVKGTPENAALGWDVQVTITFAVRP